ncbi:MAG: radical SAM protein [Oligoflexia bacterium]|nr:radical SAM protein [Oligoflexia bacterium]
MSILDRLRTRSAELLVPFQATIELTYRCNERCGHCYLATYDDHADGRVPLSREEWKRVLDQLAEAGTLVLIFIGGEAMLHPDFWELAEYGASRGFALSLITNGLLIDDRAADRLAAMRFYQVSISLYSLDPAIHDRMTRRKGSHARTLGAVERLRARGLEVIVNCLLTSANIDSCFELEDWAKARGVRVQFDPMVTPKSDSSLDPTLLRASREQLYRYYRELKRRGRPAGPAVAEPGPGFADEPVCNAGRGKCAVTAHGDLLTCLEVREVLGNFREAGFAELWGSPTAERIRGLRNRDLAFDSACGDGAFCDHCPGMAASETGDSRSEVPFLMELARIKRAVFSADGFEERLHPEERPVESSL